jgi:hypothetical protein
MPAAWRTRAAKVAAINGVVIELQAEQIADAAGLPKAWRGNWGPMGAWLRDDIPITQPVLQAIAPRPDPHGRGM